MAALNGLSSISIVLASKYHSQLQSNWYALMKKKTVKKKAPLTVSQMAAMGGKARAAALSPERRREIGLNAIKARYAKKASSTEEPPPES
jgi:hypothetical protein